jgi:hypothetical protein
VRYNLASGPVAETGWIDYLRQRQLTAKFSRCGERKQLPSRSLLQKGSCSMATGAGAFFAGIGTTFVILAAGFGGGLLTARSALDEPSGLQHRSIGEAPTPVRVVLASSSEAAQPSQQLAQQQTSVQHTEVPLPAEPAKQVQPPVEKQLEKAETRKADAEDRDRKRRSAERKARRSAEARARRHQQRAPQQEAPVMAFGGDNSFQYGGWSGN